MLSGGQTKGYITSPPYVVTSVSQIGFHQCTRGGPGGWRWWGDDARRAAGDPDRARTLVGESGDSFWSASPTSSSQAPTSHSLFASRTFLDFHRDLMVTILKAYIYLNFHLIIISILLSFASKIMWTLALWSRDAFVFYFEIFFDINHFFFPPAPPPPS